MRAKLVGPGHLPGLALPEHEMGVGVVEAVQVRGPSRALAHAPEGQLAQPPDLGQHVRHLPGLGGKDLERPELGQQAALRQHGDLAGQVRGGHGPGQGLEPGRTGVDAARTALAPALEEVGAEAQVGDHLAVGLEPGQLPEGDGTAHGHAHGGLAQLEGLAGQHDRAQPGMDQARGLEQVAVAAPEKDRQHRGLGPADDPGHAGVPGRVGHQELGELEAGHLARREHGQDVAVLEPAEGLLEPGQAAALGPGRAEGVHGDELLADLGHHAEQEIGHDLHVRPHRAQQLQQGQALDHAEGVVGHHHERALSGDAPTVRRVHGPDHAQGVQGPAHELRALLGRAGRVHGHGVEAVQGLEAQHAGHGVADQGEQGPPQGVMKQAGQFKDGSRSDVLHGTSLFSGWEFLPPPGRPRVTRP